MSKKSIRGIRDIAREAGVAISTVSCALNNTGNLSQATRERILEIAKRHNYQPSFLAKSLKRKQTGVIGLLLSSFGGEFFSELIEGIEQELNSAGLEFVICHGFRSQRVLSEGLFDGMIVLDAQVTNELIDSFLLMNKKVVVLDRPLKHPSVGEVLLNNQQGCQLVWNEIIKLQLTSLYCITGPENNYDSQQRRRSIVAEAQEHRGIDIFWCNGDFTRSSGYQQAKEILLGAQKDEKIGFFAFNDNMAWGVYDYAKEIGLIIGKDIFLIGFDNLELSHYLHPVLSSIGYDRRAWGQFASRQLVALLNAKEVAPHYIDTYLSKGGSLG